MPDSLESLIAAWEQAEHHGDVTARIARNERWIPYYSYLAQAQREREASIDPFAAAITERLFSRGLLRAGDSVLDIGSGTGAFAHAFAARGLFVTALEMEPTSLNISRMRAEKLGLSGIQYLEQMWETFMPQQQYDFVFASMCPAICNYDELMRMESCAAHACGIVAPAHDSPDPGRSRLMERLNVRPSGGMTPEMHWYDQALRLSGRTAEVLRWTRELEPAIPVQEAIQRSVSYFLSFGIPQEVSRPILTDYFASVAKDGMAFDETHLHTALIAWRVEKTD